MDNKIKNEFKGFISVLSTEICKEVLLEELKNINRTFEKTSDNYKKLGVNYAENINGIKDQLNQLQNTNKKLNEFINNVNSNSDKVSRALSVVESGHKKIIDNIITDNKRVFDDYEKKIKVLNDSERKKFISELISSMNKESEKYLSDLKSVINETEIQETLKNTTTIKTKINSVEAKVTNMGKNFVSTEKKATENFNKRIDEIEYRFINNITQTDNRINDISIELNNKITDLTVQLNKKNNIIVMLTSIVVIFSSIILFRI